MHLVLKRNFEVFSACDWLAALTAHIPNAGEHLVRYYGWYSNVSRGKRRKTQEDDPSTIEEFSAVSNAAAKRAWARLIKQVYEVDPLVCSRFGAAGGLTGQRGRDPRAGPQKANSYHPYPLPDSLQRVALAA